MKLTRKNLKKIVKEEVAALRTEFGGRQRPPWEDYQGSPVNPQTGELDDPSAKAAAAKKAPAEEGPEVIATIERLLSPKAIQGRLKQIKGLVDKQSNARKAETGLWLLNLIGITPEIFQAELAAKMKLSRSQVNEYVKQFTEQFGFVCGATYSERQRKSRRKSTKSGVGPSTGQAKG